MNNLIQKEFAKQQIDLIQAKSTISPHEQKLLEHYQRVLNPRPLTEKEKTQIEEEEKKVEINNGIYPTPEQLVDWKENGVIKDFQGNYLDLSEKISGGWNINELIIQDCPHLKFLNLKRFSQTNQADEVQERWMGSHNEQRTEFNGDLCKLTINNCPELTEIDASCNNLGNDSLIIDKDSRVKLTNLDLHNNKQRTVFNAGLYPNLEILNLDHCNLNSVILTGCAELKNFLASGNQLDELDLTDNAQLVNLTVNNNKLLVLKVNHLENLERFYCYHNELSELDCSGLSKLKELGCSGNMISALSMSKGYAENMEKAQKVFSENMEKAQKVFSENMEKGDIIKAINDHEIACQQIKNDYDKTSKKFYEQSTKVLLSNLNIDGCKNIEVLDIDCNALEKTDYSDFHQLRMLSLMYNGYIKKGDEIIKILDDSSLTLSNNPQLQRLNYYGSNYTEVRIIGCPLLVKGGNVTITSDMKPNQFLGPKGGCNIVNNAKVPPEVLAGGDDPGWGEELVERQRQQELKEISGNDSGYFSESEEQKKKNESEPIITDPFQLRNNYPDLLKSKYGQGSEITITGDILAGTLIIDGYQGYKINVGNNHSLHYLWIKNCPHLTTLRYAHCGLKNGDAFIDWDTCLKLRPENINKHNCGGEIEWGNPDQDNQKKKEEFNQESKQSVEDQKNEELKEKLYQALLDMLVKAENYADQGDWTKAELSLADVKKSVLKSRRYLSEEQLEEIMTRIEKLEQRLQDSQITTEPIPYGLIIGSLAIIFLVVGMMFWVINKWVNYDVKKQWLNNQN